MLAVIDATATDEDSQLQDEKSLINALSFTKKRDETDNNTLSINPYQINFIRPNNSEFAVAF